MDISAEIDVRCSVIVFRDDAVLLVHRTRDGTGDDGAGDWVLPGGTPGRVRVWPRAPGGRPWRKLGSLSIRAESPWTWSFSPRHR
ncbi:MAG: hypothetical protein ACRDNZ_02215 [Streptosporangiaceae bacterium]